jgi:hypothetical protein
MFRLIFLAASPFASPSGFEVLTTEFCMAVFKVWFRFQEGMSYFCAIVVILEGHQALLGSAVARDRLFVE